MSKKELKWRSVDLKGEYTGTDPGEAKKVFKSLAQQAADLRDETFEEFYGEEMDFGLIRLEKHECGHLYFKRDEEDPFFYVCGTRVDKTEDTLTQEEKVHAVTECRIPIRDN
jgi:hypothetical protein